MHVRVQCIVFDVTLLPAHKVQVHASVYFLNFFSVDILLK